LTSKLPSTIVLKLNLIFQGLHRVILFEFSFLPAFAGTMWPVLAGRREFPFDPPITSNSVQQAKQFADDLKKKLLAVDPVVFSPYLSWLQTVKTLAEEFDAIVLLDQELGEVLGERFWSDFGRAPRAFAERSGSRQVGPWARCRRSGRKH
jgi:hypothetical protein